MLLLVKLPAEACKFTKSNSLVRFLRFFIVQIVPNRNITIKVNEK